MIIGDLPILDDVEKLVLGGLHSSSRKISIKFVYSKVEHSCVGHEHKPVARI